MDGDVQGTPVRLTCVLEEKEHKLSGTCAGAGEDTTPRKVTGDVTDKGLKVTEIAPGVTMDEIKAKTEAKLVS